MGGSIYEKIEDKKNIFHILQMLNFNYARIRKPAFLSFIQLIFILLSCVPRVGKLLRAQSAHPGGQSWTAVPVGANRPSNPGRDQPESDALQHLRVTKPSPSVCFSKCLNALLPDGCSHLSLLRRHNVNIFEDVGVKGVLTQISFKVLKLRVSKETTTCQCDLQAKNLWIT